MLAGMPWSNAPGSQPDAAQPATTAAGGTGLELAQPLPDSASASMKWFVDNGVLTAPATGGEAAAGQVPAGAETISGKLPLPDGSSADVKLTELMAPSQNSRAYAVEFAVQGADAVTINGTLTVERVDTPQLSVLPGMESQPQPAVDTAPVKPTEQGAAFSMASLNASLWQAQPERPLNTHPGHTPRTDSAGQAEAAGRSDSSSSLAGGIAAEVVARPRGEEAERVQRQVGLIKQPAADGHVKLSDIARAAMPAGDDAHAQWSATSRSLAAAVTVLGQLRSTFTSLSADGVSRGGAPEIDLLNANQGVLSSSQLLSSIDGGQHQLAAGNSMPHSLQSFVEPKMQLLPPPVLDYQALAQQLMERAQEARSSGNGLFNARLDLNPPSMGRVAVNIAVQGDSVALQLAVMSQVPREQLKDSLAQLRESLEASGLTVSDLTIVEMVDGDEQREHHGQQHQHDSHDGGATEEGDALFNVTRRTAVPDAG
jgi:hypothetical protein